MSMDWDDDYTVGYGKPPKAGQFRKGRSGNPNGRPKTPTGPDSHLILELSKQITVNEDGQRKRISKYQAFMTRLVNTAISGDLAAARILCRHLERMQVRLDAIADAQPVEKPKESHLDYTTEELKAIVANGLRRGEISIEPFED